MLPTPESVYEELARTLLQDPKVTAFTDPVKKRFGSSGELKFAGKMFAFHARGRLIVKLPKARVDALIAAGEGEPCVMGQGRVMKEWVVIGSDRMTDWLAFATESRQFVDGQ